jgi:hypothetical protein
VSKLEQIPGNEELKGNIELHLPSCRWLTPEGHEAVRDFLHTIFTNKEPFNEDGCRQTGLFTATRNNEPLPHAYSMKRRLRNLDTAGRGVFAVAMPYMMPDPMAVDPLLFW